MIFPSPSPRRTGFTLLEVVLAILLLTLLVGMVFGIARNSLVLGNAVVESQNEEMLHQAFSELLSARFAALPGNTRLDLKSQDSGSHYLSDLTLQNVPLGFTWGGQERIAKAVQLSTVKKRSGFLDIVLRYYEDEILENSESTFGRITPQGPFAEIVLLEDVRFFEWRVLDGRTMDWLYDWDLDGRLPLQAELVMAYGAQGQEMRQVFWIPPKQNPEIVLRQMMQSGGQPSGAEGGGGTNDDRGGRNGNGRGGRGGDATITIPSGGFNQPSGGSPVQITPPPR
jgi:type II secretory pathway pseudopilin PulG